MRFAVARQEGLSEERAALIDEGYEHADGLTEAQKAVVAFTDASIGDLT